MDYLVKGNVWVYEVYELWSDYTLTMMMRLEAHRQKGLIMSLFTFESDGGGGGE